MRICLPVGLAVFRVFALLICHTKKSPDGKDRVLSASAFTRVCVFTFQSMSLIVSNKPVASEITGLSLHRINSVKVAAIHRVSGGAGTAAYVPGNAEVQPTRGAAHL